MPVLYSTMYFLSVCQNLFSMLHEFVLVPLAHKGLAHLVLLTLDQCCKTSLEVFLLACTSPQRWLVVEGKGPELRLGLVSSLFDCHVP